MRAGVDAIFPDSPFERRFRDMHTLSQQIQARDAHFEAVGQILLGVPPEEFLFRVAKGSPDQAPKGRTLRTKAALDFLLRPATMRSRQLPVPSFT